MHLIKSVTEHWIEAQDGVRLTGVLLTLDGPADRIYENMLDSNFVETDVILPSGEKRRHRIDAVKRQPGEWLAVFISDLQTTAVPEGTMLEFVDNGS